MGVKEVREYIANNVGTVDFVSIDLRGVGNNIIRELRHLEEMGELEQVGMRPSPTNGKNIPIFKAKALLFERAKEPPKLGRRPSRKVCLLEYYWR